LFNKSQITQQLNALYFHFLFFNPYICFNLYRVIFRGLVVYIYIQNIMADNNGCKVNVDYEPPEDDPVRVETYLGVEE
jgi:hypothetical protein